MKEYIFYVLLIFMPIGAIMVKLLLDKGLPPKNIGFIVLASLFIVISFPICIEKIGTLLSFTTYIAVLFLIIIFLFNLEKQTYLEAAAEITSTVDIVAEGENLLTEQVMAESVRHGEADAVLAIDNLLDTKGEELTIPPTTDESISKPEETIDTEEDELFASEVLQENLYEDMPVIPDSEPQSEIKPETEIELKTDAELEAKLESQLGDEPEEIPGLRPEHEDESASKQEPGEEIAVGTMPVIEEKVITAVELEETILVATEPENLADEILSSNLDMAFQYKNEGNYIKSIEYFMNIWENRKDYDLKYLVTIEIVQQYKLLGMYSEAQALLTSFFEETQGLNHNMARGLKEELILITLILEEISRLKLGEVPMENLPRLVKVKIAEVLNQLD